MASTSHEGGQSDGPNAASSASGYLEEAVEQVNRQIDGDIKAMLDAFDALVKLSVIKDKETLRIAQERFEAEARADVMVRSAQSLTLLSHALKLSLLLSQDVVSGIVPDDGQTSSEEKEEGSSVTYRSLDDEAIDLIKRTEEAKRTCSHLLSNLCRTSRQIEEQEQRFGHERADDISMGD